MLGGRMENLVILMNRIFSLAHNYKFPQFNGGALAKAANGLHQSTILLKSPKWYKCLIFIHRAACANAMFYAVPFSHHKFTFKKIKN
jgi:hypothetical protein